MALTKADLEPAAKEIIMEETNSPERTEEQETRFYPCSACKQKYEVSEARRREFACCGQKLLPFEVITKSDPTPFGP